MKVDIIIAFIGGPIDGLALDCTAEAKPGYIEIVPDRFSVLWDGMSIKILNCAQKGCSVYMPYRYEPFSEKPTHIYAFECRL